MTDAKTISEMPEALRNAIYEEGQEAHYELASIGENPYAEGTPAAECWAEGWRQARRDARDARIMLMDA